MNTAGAEVGLRYGYDRTSVAHWLAGAQPKAPVPELVAEAFTRRLGRTVTPDALGFAHVPAQRSGDTDARPLLLPDGDGLPYRDLAQLPKWRELTVRSSAAEPCRAPRRIGEAEVGLLGDAVRHFVRAMQTHGGSYARSALSDYLSHTLEVWLRAPAAPDVQRALREVGSQLLFVFGLMHADMGAHGLAQHGFTTSLELANEAGDRTSWAIGLRALSAQALVIGHRGTALQAARAAVDASAGRAPAAVRAYALTQLAVVHAALQEDRAAFRALDQAEVLLPADDEDDGRPFRSYPVSAFVFQRAEAHRRLGHLAPSLRALRRSADVRAPHDRRSLALTLGRRAQLLFLSGQVEEACAASQVFLTTRAGLRSRTVGDTSRAILRALAPYKDHRAVRGLLQYEAETATCSSARQWS
ncbi:hypothetical protein [Streptomyces sp. N35]|uniref:hypothetical protein n=1 Tax=Streptomyces sp. N35 TaxID=2795730 RepID=UPI0018F4F5CF|nr:hypothetical protein [Streptomyces sp. N35]